MIECVTIIDKLAILISTVVNFFDQIVNFEMQYLILKCLEYFRPLLALLLQAMKMQQQLMKIGIQS